MTKNNFNYNKIADFFFEIGTLRNMKRMQSQVIPQSNDTISSHSFEITIIGMMLAKMEELNENKVIKMCLFHDIAEARTGDTNFIHSHYIKKNENQATKDQLSDTPIKKEITEILDEFIEGKSHEALVAKDADLISQLISQCTHLKESKDIARWNRHTAKNLKTKSAKKLAQIISEKNPFEWFYNFPDATE